MAILFVLLIPIAIALFVIFDVMLYLEHEGHIDEWIKDGRPGGFFWRPEGSFFWSGSFSRTRLASAWLFSTPTWMAADPRAKRLLFWYRTVWWILIIGWLVSLMTK